MDVTQILQEVDMKYPNDVENAHKWEWITQLEKMLLHESLMTHELSEEEQQRATEIDKMQNVASDYQPLAQPPYQDIYIHYLGMQISLVNTDTDQYENEQTLYNNALLAYKNWFNRTHRARISGGERWRF